MQGRRAGQGWRREFAQTIVFILVLTTLAAVVPSLRMHPEVLPYIVALVLAQSLDRTLRLRWWPASSNGVWRLVRPVFIAVILLLLALLASAVISGLRW
jgi:hypothetical protein